VGFGGLCVGAIWGGGGGGGEGDGDEGCGCSLLLPRGRIIASYVNLQWKKNIMKQRYQGIFILDLKGKEDSLQDVVDSIVKEIVTGGGEILETQKMGRKRFMRGDHDVDSGYYLNIQFSLEPNKLSGLRHKLKFNDHVFRQLYLREIKPKSYSNIIKQEAVEEVVTDAIV
jgi:small subunit ribosomal protein S6